MKAATLREHLEKVREAGHKLRRRPATDTLDSLCRVLDLWRDPRSQWRRQLAAELPGASGFSRETVRRGLALARPPAQLRVCVRGPTQDLVLGRPLDVSARYRRAQPTCAHVGRLKSRPPMRAEARSPG